MITTSTTYNTIFADPSHYAETKIVVGNTTYDENTIMACERTQTLFGGYYDIGNTVINQITFTLIGVTAEDIPRMSRVEVWTRIKNATLTSEWIPMGVYYTLKPTYDTESQILEVTGYDEMYKTAVVPFEQGVSLTAWNDPNIRQVAEHLTSGTVVTDVIDTNFAGIGVALEDPTQIPTGITMGSTPFNFTVREILTDIAIASCGNWLIVFQDDGNGGQVSKLRLVMNTEWDGTASISLGRNVTSFTKGDEIQPVTHVYVYYGYDSNGAVLYGEAVADTDDGRTYEVEVKTITDGTTANQIASNILIGMSGDIQYVPFTATGAELDIATEVGDTVSINSITSVFGTITYNFNKGMWADIEAVGLEQVDEFEELQSSNRVAQRIERSSEVNSAKIAVNADAINAEVTRATGAESDLNTTLSSRITQTASDLTLTLTQYAQDQVNNHAVEQQQYIRYGTDGLELGESGTNAKAVLDNTSLKFYDPTNDVKAYIGLDNLWNSNTNALVVGGINGGTGANQDSTTRVRTSGYMTVSPSTEYRVTGSFDYVDVFEYSTALSSSFLQASGWIEGDYTFTTTSTTNYIRLLFRKTDASATMTVSDVSDLEVTATSSDYKFFITNGHIVQQLELGDHWLLTASGSDNDYRLTFKWRA